MIDFAKERDNAFIHFVKTGRMGKEDAYCKKYGISMPENPKVKKAAIYKAVMYCTNIPEDIKDIAMANCLYCDGDDEGFVNRIPKLRGANGNGIFDKG